MSAICSCVNGKTTSVIALTAVGMISSSTMASVTAPVVSMLWDASGDSVGQQVYNMNSESTEINDLGVAGWQFLGGTSGAIPSGGGDSPWSMQWDIRASGPSNVAGGSTAEFVNANLAVTNNTGGFQTFWALVTVNIAGFTNETVNMRGSVSGTVTDLLGDGAILRNQSAGPFAGDPMYQGLIGGVSARTMWPNGTAVNAGAFGSNGDGDTFGFPGDGGFESFNVVGSATTISVWLKVELSGFDIGTTVGSLEVYAAPAPGALALLGLGGLVGSRRRRS
ncbi:MAG TPA: hypothetical protein VG711_03380 [Phycisphaerales bacterium]|nr:hypothetical protein [Phycisphaerales bacterium]